MHVSDELTRLIRNGFGDSPVGEDRFDSLVGLAGMLEVVLGKRPEMPLMSSETRLIEGWILGQAD